MSFFGFDTTNPDITKKKKRGSKQKKEPAVKQEFDGDALDRMLEKKYAQEEGIIDEYDDEDNLETFEVDKQELEKDFDFSQQPSLQQIEAQMRRSVQAPMSLDQVEAQLRSGPPKTEMYRAGMDQSFRPPIQQMFNRPMMPGAGQMHQPHMPMHSGQMQRPIHPQSNVQMQRLERPMQNLGPSQIQRPMQQLGLGQMQRPSQPHPHGQIQRPSMPKTIVIDGITVTPIELTNQEKDSVFLQLQQMQPMAPHIDTLLRTISSLGGEQEADNLKNLNEIKNVLKSQLDLINRGIFIIRPEVALQLRNSLLQFFQYGENLMKKSQAPVENSVEVPEAEEAEDDVEIDEKAVEEIIRDDEELVEEEVEEEVEELQEVPEQETKKSITILKREPEKEKKKKLVLEKKVKKAVVEEEVEIIKFEENDFPALGKEVAVESEHKLEVPHIRIAARKGNQKQRREEQKERMGAQSVVDEKLSAFLDPSIPRVERYAGLMRKHEKELIAKIQISQLVTDDPFVDDFYFQMKALAKKKLEHNPEKKPKKKSKKSGKWQESVGQLVDGTKGSGAVISNQMQQQMKRLIESRRALKPREGTSAALEGALGKISAKSSRAPKQSIEVAPSSAVKSQPSASNTLSALADLQYAEEIMDAVIRFEDFNHGKPPKDEEEKEEREKAKTNALNDLWRILAPSKEIPSSTPHPLVCSLNRVKGLAAVSRGLLLLDSKQSLGFFSVLFKRIECLNVMNYALGKESEKVEAFMNSIFPELTSIVNDAAMNIIGALMRIILERHNLLWFAKSRVGLVILTMMLSRAEMLKQGVISPENAQLPEEELGMWSEIYEFMFSSFKGQFPALFSKETSPADEVFVWQFLSAMAVGASGIDHQKVLVTELRENVIQTAKTNHPKALENVNLFLTALGLNIDAAQLAAMSQ